MGNILILAEQRDGAFKATTLSAVTFARQVAGMRGCGYDILVVGSGVSGAAAEAAKYGAGKVYVVDKPELANYLAQSYAFVTAEVAAAAGADLVCTVATTTGPGIPVDPAVVRNFTEEA